MKLDGKVTVITGAASGIGAACAQAFSNAGSQVAVVDVDFEGAKQVADAVGGIAIHCDLGDPSAIDRQKFCLTTPVSVPDPEFLTVR